MTKTLTEDPSEFVRLVLTLFILGPIGSPDNSILIFFLQNLSLEKKLRSLKTAFDFEKLCGPDGGVGAGTCISRGMHILDVDVLHYHD